MIKEYLPFYRRNLKVAGPIMLAQVGGAIVQLVDTFMVGRLGTIELAAVSFASAVFVIGFVAATGLLMGATPIIGQLASNEKNKSRIVQIFQNLFLLASIVAVFVTILLLIVYFIMPHMGQVPEVVVLARPYYLTLVFSIIPFLLFAAFRQFLEGVGNTSIAMVVTLLSNVVNIILNYFLIYGKCGFPEMGVLGAGVATLISRVLMPIMCFVYFKYKSKWLSYIKPFNRYLFDKATLRELWSVGSPIMAHLLMEVSAFAFSGIMIGWLGAVELASNQIAQNMSHILFMVVLGISAATTIRVSHQYGARDYHAMRMASNASIHLCLMANAIMGSLLIIFRTEVASLFSDDPQVIYLGSQLLIFSGIFQLSDGMQAVGAGILRGLKDVKIIMLYSFISYVIINLPLGYFLGFVCEFGAEGVWCGFICSLSAAAILFRLRYLKQFKKIEREFAMEVRE